MNYEERIAEIEKEIVQFDYERLKRLEQIQQIQAELQQIEQGVWTRKGEIIGLKRIIKEQDVVSTS